ncbi:iron-responsive transcriptional regulator RirA [Aureimonas populi]|uniref:Iron-responsive transcriptional regulator RirA n=1 Tax=Aureimonas populi TaxID=1701758 RepID=A0ABW5CM20_9HYPH|nr:iron-responsive transcriptional regulator RirA [Aureimonas populi]
MRLTRQTNYALRMLMYCAANEGRLSRVGEIAAAYSVSELFLFKILQPLVEAGFVETVRGRNGGVRLARPAGSITLRAVVEVTEESFVLAECFEPGAADCPLIDSCSLNAALRQALEAFLGALGEHTIASLVGGSNSIHHRLGLAEPTGAPAGPVPGTARLRSIA